ncbi:MAG: hypothetical protein A2Y38_17130 [Spirochaetes bacterium GWB1_59_5]|nr:MAG: hypothetical protein A2Y38_17130 [Spirochaetes bacterium GWB1_59_5]
MAGRRALTRQMFDKLVEAYREAPGQHKFAGRNAGVFHTTAKKAWDDGWPTFSWGTVPIKEIIRQEQTIARARAAEIDAARQEAAKRNAADAAVRGQELAVQVAVDREKVRQDAIKSRTEEAQAVRLARGNSISTMASLNRLLRSTGELVKGAEKRISENKDMTPLQVVKFAKDVSQAVKQTAEATHTAMQMERLLLGDNNGAMNDLPIDMSPEEAANEIKAAQAALTRAEALGLLDGPGGPLNVPPPPLMPKDERYDEPVVSSAEIEEEEEEGSQ